MYDVIVYVRKVLWGEIKKHMVGVSSQICLRASLVKSGCFTDLETLQCSWPHVLLANSNVLDRLEFHREGNCAGLNSGTNLLQVLSSGQLTPTAATKYTSKLQIMRLMLFVV